MAVWYTTMILLTLGLCAATYNICPENSVNSTHSAFGATNYVQKGVWHQVPCPSFRPDEAISRVIWYKQDSPTTPEQTLITHKHNADYPESDRYAFGTSGFSLVIEGVEESDGGRYLCQVLPRDTISRLEEISIQVIGDTFPGGSGQASSTASFQRGRRQTLLCECASQTPEVVYWSTGEGGTTDTQIIAARFSDGTTLQIQHGADFNVGSDASLTINSLNDVQDAQRFWCHVFQSDGTLRNCDTNAQISDEMESASDALKASERSFYLRDDSQQILPCLSWTPGDTACEVEWSKLDNPDRQILSYNLSTGVVDSSPELDLASDFGLVIQSVDDDHAGVYRCAVGDENQIDVEVRVIGDRFPLDGGSAKEGDSVTIKPETRFSLQCPALSDISLTTKATLFWSFGANDAESATVIGTLNLPDGPQKMYDLGKDCLGISMEGALLFNNCSQDDDVRYWCHVFPANDNLIRSYVDVLIENSNGGPRSSNVFVIAVCVTLFVIVLGIVVFLILKRRRRSLHSREDKEKGDYKRLDKQESVPELDLKTLASKIKMFVISKLGRIPITPWVDGDDACFASISTVYRPLEMFANVSYGGSTVKYQLDSESGIFDDGIPEFASKHAIIQGRRGCGKTTFLYRLIYDWAMGREGALWGSDQIVVLVPAWLLIKDKTIGKAVVECMLPKDANISAESINAHFARDKSNLTVLVDDCNDKDDIDAVMKVMTDNGFLGCQLVLTTGNVELAKAASHKHNMRYVIITGFTLRNALEYINVVLDTAEVRNKATPEHKAVKSKAEPKSASTADRNIEQHLPKAEDSLTVSAPPETKDSTVTGRYPKKTPRTPTTNNKRNLHRYLEELILQTDISCLPAVLVALCQLSIWTKGDAFKPDVTMSNVIFRLVKCMFDRMKGMEVGVNEGHQLSLLTEDQLNVLAELGRVVYSRLVDSCLNYADYAEEDFLSSSDKGGHALEVAKEVGLIRPLKVESKVESTEQITEADLSEVEIRTGLLCCKRKQKQQNVAKRDPIGQGTELTPLTSHNDERVGFVLEIIEQLCVAVFITQSTGQMKTLSKDTKFGHGEILQRFSNVFHFAIEDNQFDREALVDYCVKLISRGYSEARPFHDMLQLQKFIELCLQLNFEGQFEGALNKKLKSIFPDGRVRLIGISSCKLRLLSYLLEHAQPEDKSKLNVKSIELLRIGQYDWSELVEYMEYFRTGKGKPENKKKKMEITTKKKASKTKTEDTQPSSTGTKQARAPEAQKGVTKLSTDAMEIYSSINEPQPNAEKQPKSKADQKTITDPRTEGDNKPKLEVLQYSPPAVSESSNKDGGNENESIDLSLDKKIASDDVIESNNDQAVSKKLCEIIHSRNHDMPQFPPGMSDVSVLHTVQSFGLQELLESQAGECYSSGAARDLACYLPRLEMLESLVLVGTILSSDAICDLAKRAHRLQNLKKLDLRLNRQFDDRAFVAVTNLPLHQCKKLRDLRLSLYKVSIEGFDEVQKEIKDGENSWDRLKTLYLLHGSPAEKFVGFLSNSLQYFHFVECFHFSAAYKQDRIPDNIQKEFEQNMNNPKVMPNLEALDIGNMETLQARLTCLKLPKKKRGTVMSKIVETIDMWKKTETENEKSTTASEIAE
ncbi:uncharacterized protein LOC119732152 [Patiria miniata]|uniref:Ig-like domain-containing protein n=1 Tax=Patiria miniata TaxID=46514 RepID=A0A914ACB2_PATMI|nr:uncharacterized protein LOC119732152 [Patiria miniata]